jgi:hypothetical protein
MCDITIEECDEMICAIKTEEYVRMTSTGELPWEN